MTTSIPHNVAREGSSDEYTPKKEDKFTFGLWTVFGDFVRPDLPPVRSVQKLSELGAYGISLHDNDLVPFGVSATERERIVSEFKQALADYGMVVPMATTNLFFHPIFKDGAFTSLDPAVRAFALQKTMSAIDLGAELGASTYVFWGGREGVDSEASKDPVVAIKRMRDAINFLCQYVMEKGYKLHFALEPKPNEPRSDTYLPTIGHMLAFIYTLDHPEMVGLNPEVAHEQMAGLNFVHGVAQALEAGKLFNIDLNDQKGPRYDQDLRFGSESIKSMFFLVKVLEDYRYMGRATSTRMPTAPRASRACGILHWAVCARITCSRPKSNASMLIERSRLSYTNSTVVIRAMVACSTATVAKPCGNCKPRRSMLISLPSAATATNISTS